MNRMTKIFLALLLMSSVIFANTVDRRRVISSLKSAKKMISDLHQAFPEAKQIDNKYFHLMNISLKDSQNAYAAGLIKEGRSNLLLAHRAKVNLLRTDVQFLMNKARDILYKLSSDLQKGDKPNKKAFVYFKKARSNIAMAKKFYVDKNYKYSIFLLKDSIIYSMLSYKTLNFSIHKDYVGAWEYWHIKKKKK